MVLASTDEPSGASTRTRQVISNECDVKPAAALDTMDFELMESDAAGVLSLSPYAIIYDVISDTFGNYVVICIA